MTRGNKTKVIHVDFKHKKKEYTWEESRDLDEFLETMRQSLNLAIKMLIKTGAPKYYIDQKTEEFQAMMQANYQRVFDNG